jgi:hypothetical protein
VAQGAGAFWIQKMSFEFETCKHSIFSQGLVTVIMMRSNLLAAAALAALSVANAQTTTVNTVTYDTRACQAPYNTFPFWYAKYA